MSTATIAPEIVRDRLETAYLSLDIPAEVERHTSTRLHAVTRGKQYGGACPFDDCSVDTDGFTVWPLLTPRGSHYYCRGCHRSGDIVKLLQEVRGLSFSDACNALGIPNPYLDGESNGVSRMPMKTRAPKAEQWQLDELQYANNIYPRAKLALQRDRARAYLAERGIPFELAVKHGVGYIPALSEVKSTPELERFRRWCDRIIFPIYTPKGEMGYCGRSLFLWEPGMDEDEHKKRIDAYNLQMKEQHGERARWHQMPRWKYTYQQGFFNWQAMQDAVCPVFVEGPFDVLACLASGIECAISIGTTGIDAQSLPANVYNAVMALDVDGAGSKAAKLLAKALRRKGIDVQICMPIAGKDWSAVYRLNGEQGLALLKQLVISQGVPDSELDKCYRCKILFPNYEGWDVEKIPLDDLDMRYDPTNGELYCLQCRPQLFEKDETRQENNDDTWR